ncbi:hypothetical protein [Sphingomonas sp.]|uniref:hypothetical protein n=1 Tax=Sphingomonas sp. TaxID=28214 RepID=UPI003CC5E264
MAEDATDTPIAERPRARAVFSPADFALMKDALGEFIRTLPAGDPRAQQASNLHHRLGRID